MVLLRAVVAAAVVAAAGPSLYAQTADPAFGAWRWAPEPPGSRPAGLGSAYVAVADGVRAASINPAGLALIPDWELGVSSARFWTGAAHGGKRVRLAAYIAETDTPSSGGPELDEEGPLTARVREVGLAGALEPVRGVRLGVTASWARLRVDGDPFALAAAPDARVSMAGESTRLRWTLGALVDLTRRHGPSVPSLRLGFAVQPGLDWSVDRSVSAPEAALETTSVELRRPTLVSAGLAWRSSGRWTIAAEADLIRYSEVLDTLTGTVGSETSDAFELGDAVEPRLGLEFAAPLSCGCGNVRVRGGVRGRSPGSLRYSGDDAALASAFPGASWRAVFTLGASLVGEYFGRAIRLDLDSTDLLEGPRLSVGATVRF
jgi:hypothetical protein